MWNKMSLLRCSQSADCAVLRPLGVERHWLTRNWIQKSLPPVSGHLAATAVLLQSTLTSRGVVGFGGHPRARTDSTKQRLIKMGQMSHRDIQAPSSMAKCAT